MTVNPRRPIVMLGGGGHATVLLELLKLVGEYFCVGYVAPRSDPQFGAHYLGGDEFLKEIFQKSASHALVGFGSVRDASLRLRVFQQLLDIGYSLPVMIHPQSLCAADVSIDCGSQIMRGAVVQPRVSVGRNVIINTGAIVEHDCIVEDHAHIASGAVLAGNVHIEEAAHIGAGSVILQDIHIGARAVIGAGAVVTRNVPAEEVVIGNPARPHATVSQDRQTS